MHNGCLNYCGRNSTGDGLVSLVATHIRNIKALGFHHLSWDNGFLVHRDQVSSPELTINLKIKHFYMVGVPVRGNCSVSSVVFS